MNYIPSLNDIQKSQIKKLMTDYFNNRNKFIYEGNTRRESYAYPKVRTSGIEGCVNSSNKYYLNCGVFAQMIWMGRKISDFSSNITKNISKEFDWGYYFDFEAAKNAYGILKSSGRYYENNSYIDENGDRKFITFDNAAAMAMELYYKGYEIPYSSVDIGDLVFYRTESEIDGDKDELEQTSFKNITHVGLVYDIDLETNCPIIIECSSAYSASIGKCSINSSQVTTFGLVRGAGLTTRIVMAARHPAAFNTNSNVPNYFEIYRKR